MGERPVGDTAPEQGVRGSLSGPVRLSAYSVDLPPQLHAGQLVLALEYASKLPEPAEAPTLREFAPRFIEHYARANRQKPAGITSKLSHLNTHLLPMFGETRIDAVTHEGVQALKVRLAEHSAKTVNNVLSTLSVILKTAVRWELIRRMPVRIEPLKTVDPAFSFYEVYQYRRLQQGAALRGPRQLAAILLGGDCGLRMGEVRGLEWKDLDFERHQIHVARAISEDQVTAPKGNKTRFVPLTPEAAAAVRNVVRRDARVFLNDFGEPISEQTLRTWLSNSQKSAGLPARGATHVLRHTYCSHLAMAGVPLLAIKELAGHVSERTTMRYMHLAPSEKGRALEALAKYRDQR
jgi:integrase